MISWIRWGLLLSFMLVAHAVQAIEVEPIPLDSTKGSSLVGPSSFVLVDPSKVLDLGAAQKAWEAGQFQKELAQDPNYGFTTHAYWYRFSAQNLDQKDKAWYFGLEYPLVNHIDLYVKGPDNTWVQREAGNFFDFDQRDLKNRFIYLKLDFKPGEQKDFFLRLQTDGSSEFRMIFKDLPTIYRADHDIQFYLGGCMGLLLVLAAYYFLVTLNTRAIDILWLSICMGGLFIFRMAVNGFAFEYLWPGFSSWAHMVTAFSVPMVFGAAITNAYYFLPMQNYRKFRIVCRVFMTLNWSFAALSFVLPYRMLKLYTLLGILTAALIIATSVYSQIQGFRPARYFVYAWSAMLFGSITFGLQKLGLIPVTFLGTYGPEIATVTLAVLLSLGVSDKINATNLALRIAQEEALKAQIETNRLQEVMNTQLELQVRERTEELWKQTKGVSVMLDNINQGICTIDGDFIIQPQHSQYLDQIINDKDLEGKSLLTLLFDHCNLAKEVRDILFSTVNASIGGDLMQFEINDHLLPRLVTFTREKSVKILELDWAGIEDKDGSIEKLLVSIRDATAIRKAEETAAIKQKELEVIGKILDLSASKFRRFIKSSSVLIEESRQKLDDLQVKDSWHVVLRNIHTIKGNARTYQLMDISSAVHELENDLFAINAEKITKQDVEACQQGLTGLENLIGFYQRIHDEKLKRGAVADTENLIVQASKMMSDVWPDLTAEKRRRYSQTLLRFDALNTNSLKKVIQPIIESLPSLAQQLNKTPPNVLVTGDDFFVDPEQLNFFEDIFVHLMRNSLDHGFLLGDEGRIQIDITHGKEFTELVYFDSGRGLNLPTLRKRGLEKGLIKEDASDLDVARSIFIAGVSSAKVVTEISGRGVGMDAAKGCVDRLRGKIDIRLLGEGNIASYQRFEFRIQLPLHNQLLHTLHIEQAA